MTPRTSTRDDSGAVLVLALIFMIVIALVLVAVVSFAGDGLASTTNLVEQQSLEYRSSGAMQIAIQTVRYTDTTFPTYPSAIPTSCFSSNAGVPVGQNSPPVYVDCQTVMHAQLPANTEISREVYFYACSTSSTNCSSTNYTIEATVDFVDGPGCTTTSFGDCGAGSNGVPGENIKSWLVHNANS